MGQATFCDLFLLFKTTVFSPFILLNFFIRKSFIAFFLNKNIRHTSSYLPQATMAEPETNSQTDIFNGLTPPPQKSRKINGLHYLLHRYHQNYLCSRPALFSQRKKCHQRQSPGRHSQRKSPRRTMQKIRVSKYAQYFKGNKILPMPELVETVQPKTLFFIVTDLRTRRLAGIKRDTKWNHHLHQRHRNINHRSSIKKDTKTIDIIKNNRCSQKCYKPIPVKGCTYGDHLCLLSW